MPDPAFPLALPTPEEHLRSQNVGGVESIAERTARQENARLAAEQAKQAAALETPSDWASQQLESQREQAELEAKYGRIGAIGTATARGIFDAALSVPALAGAGLESAGALTGIDTLRDFGRDVGRASTGSNALGSFAAAQAAVFGEDPRSGYEAAQVDMANKAKAWPLLTTISQGAGTVIGTVATGGLGLESEGASVAQKALSAGVQGAGFGAEQGYEKNAPLREILTSSLLGGALAGGTAGLLAKGQEWLASPAAREAFEGAAGERAIKALGARATEVSKLRSGGLTGEEAARAIGKDVLDYKLANGESIFPQSLREAATLSKEQLGERVTQGAAEVGEKLGAIRQAAAQFTESKAPQLLPDLEDLSGKIVDDVIKPLESSNLTKGKAGVIYDVIGDLSNTAKDGKVTLSQLLKTREILDAKIWPKPAGGGLTRLAPEAFEDLVKTRSIIDDAIGKTIDAASKEMGGETLAGYNALKSTAQSLIQARQIVNPSLGRDLGHRVFSMSDMLAGAAEFGGEISHGEGGALLGGVKGLAVAAAHKYIRQQGSTIAAVGLRKLAQGAPELAEAIEPFGVSVAAAGGREAQQVINLFSRSRQAIADSVEAAGPNPDLRAVAQQDEADRQSQALAARAGNFDPASWQESTPTAVQKVVFRGPILDQVSQDFAGHMASAMQLAPDRDLTLSPDRIQKLTRNADGTSAIGRLQSIVSDIVQSAPQTVWGDQMLALAGQARNQLSSSDVPSSMLLAHELAGSLRTFAEHAQDQVSQEFANRQASALHDGLSSEDFGKAGQLYAQAFPDVPSTFQDLTDPENVRESLRGIQSKGQLQDAVEEFTNQIRASHDARKELSGEGPDKAIAEQLKGLQKFASKAEDAVTLDGGPIGRVFDHFDGNPNANLPHEDPGTLVLRTMSDRMQRLIPSLRYGSEEPADDNKPPARSYLTAAEKQAQYKDHLDQLSQIMADPGSAGLADMLRGHPKITPDLAAIVASDSQQKLAQLMQDMPKPQPNIRGKAFETLSSDDVRKGLAMWEATVKPLSIFDDFRSGNVDYDKVQYAWKQYPGLQSAAQAAMLDVMTVHLDDAERARVPDRILTQCDYLLGFDGRLQGSCSRELSSTVDAAQQQIAQQRAQAGTPLKTPLSGGTFTERMMKGK